MPIPGHAKRYRERSAIVTADERKQRANTVHDQRQSYRERVRLLKVSQMRRAIFNVIKPGALAQGVGNRIYDTFIIVVAFLSLLPLMFKNSYPVVTTVEHLMVYLLLIDYMLRWITADLNEGREGRAPFVRYPIRPLSLCVLVGILPSLGALPPDLGYLRVLRIATVFYYTDDLFFIGGIIRSERRTLISVIGLVAGYILITGTVLYAVEPDTFGNFIDAIYWSIISFTSTGYGDYYPHGYLGKVITSISMFFSILVIAVPTGVITAGYMREIRKRRQQGTYYFKPRSMKEVYLEFRENGGIRGYFSERGPLVRYLGMMGFCLAIDIILITIAHVANLPLWLDTIGTALASSFLECAAGILVGLGSNIALAIVRGDPTQILYYVVPAVTAIAYASAFQRGKDITIKKVVRVVVTVVVIATVWDIVLAYLVYNGVPSGVGEGMFYYVIAARGMPDFAAKVVAVFIIECIDKVLTALFVVLIHNIAPDAWKRLALPPAMPRGADVFREGWFTK